MTLKNVEINIKGSSAPFENGLFGVNAEITRKGFFGGLSAEMINNRKLFSGADAPSGWACSGYEYVKDKPELSLCGSSFVLLDGGRLSQTSDVISTGGGVYTAKVWVKALSAATVTFGLSGYEKSFELEEDGEPYRLLSFDFECGEVRCGTFSVSVCGRAYVFETSLMAKDNFYGMRRDVIEALKYVRPSSVRFPGGCAADHFQWKESLKAPEFRKPVGAGDKWFLFRDTYDQDCLDIGINEFMMLCRELDAEPEYTVSLLLSDAEDAYRLVQYCNGDADTEYGAKRQALGFDKFGVRYWYIGNEVYFFGGKYKDDAVLAAKKTAELTKAVRRADPSAVPVMGLTWAEGFKQWNYDFVSALDCDYGYVSYHNYIGILPDETQGENGMATKEMLEGNFADGVDAGLDFYKNGLYKDSFDKINVFADEWNYTWGRDSSNALFFSNALQFHFFAKSGEKYHIRRAQFFMPVNEGMITVNGGSVRVESTGELFRLMRGHENGVLFHCGADPSADVLCTGHGDHVFISVVNRGGEPLEVSVNGHEITGSDQIVTDGYGFDCNGFAVVGGDTVLRGHSVMFIKAERVKDNEKSTS